MKIFSLGPDEDRRTCWKLVSLKIFNPVHEKLPDYIWINRMRNLHSHEITMLDNQISVQGVYIWICTLHLKIWVSVWTSFETGGIYLTAYLRTASENLNSHLILVTSPDNFWGGKLWNCHFDHYMSVVMWNCHSWPLHVSSNVKLPFLTTTCQ